MFSIIIITRNRGGMIRNVLKSIKALNYLRDRFELLMVDNGSNDNTSEVIQDELSDSDINWKLVREPEKGICRARNTGFYHAQGDWVGYLDDDVLIPESWLDSYEKAIENYPDVAAFGGPAILDKQIIRPWWWISEFDKTMSCQNFGKEYIEYPERMNPYGLNMVFRRSVLEEMGGFDVRLDSKTNSFADETELFIRLYKKEMKTIYVPDAVVIHSVLPERLCWKSLMNRYLLVGRSHACLDEMHGRFYARSLYTRLHDSFYLFMRHGSPAVFFAEFYSWLGYKGFGLDKQSRRM